MALAAAKFTELELPPFFDPKHASDFNYRPHPAVILEYAERVRRERSVRQSTLDDVVVNHICIDRNKCFCHNTPIDLLYVKRTSPIDNAEANCARMAEYMYRNALNITNSHFTIDGHPTWHVGMHYFYEFRDGRVVPPFSWISVEQLENGDIRPRPFLANLFFGGSRKKLLEHVLHIVREIRRKRGDDMFVWPPHGYPGDPQCDLVGVIAEYAFFHDILRGTNNPRLYKATDPLLEFFSPFRAEADTLPDGSKTPDGVMGRDFLIRMLHDSDIVIVEGEAANFCAGFGLLDLILLGKEIHRVDLLQKIFVIEDGMSSVTMDDPVKGVVEVGAQKLAILNECRDMGMRVVPASLPMANYFDV